MSQIGMIIGSNSKKELYDQYPLLNKLPNYVAPFFEQRTKPKILFDHKYAPIPIAGIYCPLLQYEQEKRKREKNDKKAREIISLCQQNGIRQVIWWGENYPIIEEIVGQEMEYITQEKRIEEFLTIETIKEMLSTKKKRLGKVALIGKLDYYLPALIELLVKHFTEIAIVSEVDVALEKLQRKLFYEKGMVLDVGMNMRALLEKGEMVIILQQLSPKAGKFSENLQASFLEKRVIYDTIGLAKQGELNQCKNDTIVRGAVVQLSAQWNEGIPVAGLKKYLPSSLVGRMMTMDLYGKQEKLELETIESRFGELGFKIWDIQISK